MTKDVKELIDLAAKIDKVEGNVEKAGRKIKRILKRLDSLDIDGQELYIKRACENIRNAAWSLGEAERVLCYIDFPDEEERKRQDEENHD